MMDLSCPYKASIEIDRGEWAPCGRGGHFCARCMEDIRVDEEEYAHDGYHDSREYNAKLYAD